MKTALERAARAFCSLDGNPENAMMDAKPLWRDYVPEARAVRVAIREPHEVMRHAGEGISEDHRNDAVSIWHAMIDAALADEK
jgi:hypothetical protein